MRKDQLRTRRHEHRGAFSAPETSGPSERSGHLAGLGLAAVAAVAFGTLAIFAKLAYRQGASALPLLAGRFILTALLLAAYHLARRVPLSIRGSGNIGLVSLLGLGYALESFLFFLALENAPAAVVSLVFYSFPMWTALLAFVARLEAIKPTMLLALALGTGGVALIFSIPTSSLAGPLIALAAAFVVAVYLLIAQVTLGRVVPSVAATWTAAGAAVALSIASAVTGSPLPAESLPATGALGVATAIAFTTWYEAIARIGSSRTAVATMLEPVATVVLAAIVLSEEITPRMMLGAVLVVAALPVLASAPRRPHAPPEPI